MSEVIIQVDNVSKSFKLPHEKHGSLKSLFVNMLGRGTKYEKQKVLKDVSFDIKKGEFFGIVGRNGSGKSTLLKLLAGVYSPNKGHIQINGKLTPFIELGVGFNPELSGRDNVFLNGALLGFSKKEMETMYDSIVEFAELEKFMDQKLRNYSSGMQVRLAFSIAIRAQSDILLLDEVLAVGDEAFQQKCLEVFEEHKANKQTVILVTHDMEMVKKYCDRAMLINNGEISDIGETNRIALKYSKLNQQIIADTVNQSESRLRLSIKDLNFENRRNFNFSERMTVVVDWKELNVNTFESIGVHIFKLSGEHLTGINSRTSKDLKNWKDKGSIQINFDLKIIPGKYYVIAEMFSEPGKIYETSTEGVYFIVEKTQMTWSGLVELDHKWVSENES